MNTIIAADTCTLNHVHNISTIGSTLTSWTTEDSRLIEAIVNKGDRDRLAQDLPSLCSTQITGELRVESWMSFLAGRIEWINTNDTQLLNPASPYIFRIQFPWAKSAVPAIEVNRDTIRMRAQSAGVSDEMMLAFYALWGLGLACVDGSNLMLPFGNGMFGYKKGKVYYSGDFETWCQNMSATQLALEYIKHYYIPNKEHEFQYLLRFLLLAETKGVTDGVQAFLKDEANLLFRTIYTKEGPLTEEDLLRVRRKKGKSGFMGIDLGKKGGTLHISIDNLPKMKIPLTNAETALYLLLMQHPEGFTRRELFDINIMRDYLTIEHYLHGEPSPSDREVEMCGYEDKSQRDKLNKSLQRLRDKLADGFAKQKGYDYSMFIPTAATSITPKSATKIALTALQSPNKIQCYIPDEIQNLISDSAFIAKY